MTDASKIAEHGTQETKAKVREGKLSVSKAVKGPEFDTAKLDRQPSRNTSPKKSGKPTVSKKDRTDAQKHLGGLIRALKTLDIYDEFVKSLSAIADRLKRV